jgi:hypothetical protein
MVLTGDSLTHAHSCRVPKADAAPPFAPGKGGGELVGEQ